MRQDLYENGYSIRSRKFMTGIDTKFDLTPILFCRYSPSLLFTISPVHSQVNVKLGINRAVLSLSFLSSSNILTRYRVSKNQFFDNYISKVGQRIFIKVL